VIAGVPPRVNGGRRDRRVFALDAVVGAGGTVHGDFSG